MKLINPKSESVGYCIFLDSFCDERTVAVHGKSGPLVFPTKREAEMEIANQVIVRLQEFFDGKREFEDALTVEEYVLAVLIDEDGRITTE